MVENHKKRYYYVVLNTVPESVFTEEELYPKSEYGKNHTRKWLMFWTNDPAIPSAFEPYLIVSPPPFMTKTLALTAKEANTLAGTEAENGLEDEGWGLKND